MKAKPKAEAVKSGDKTVDNGKKHVMCSHCGRSGHSQENCFFLHPEKRPGPRGFKSWIRLGKVPSSGGCGVEEEDGHHGLCGTSIVVQASVRRHRSSSTMDAFLYGASGQVSATVAPCAQTTAQVVAPSSTPVVSSGHPRHVKLPDHIGQSRLPLSFSIADAAPAITAPSTSMPQTLSTHRDAAYSLAYKVLQLPVFARVDFLTRISTSRCLSLGGKYVGRPCAYSLIRGVACCDCST